MTHEPKERTRSQAELAQEPITLGILQTGDVHRDLEAAHGAYPEMFTRLLQPAAPELRFEVFRALDGALPARVEACDAYLVTGSKFGVYDPEPWIAPLEAFLRAAHKAGVPLIGVCFGHQILAQALGGVVRKSEKGWGLGAHAYEAAPSAAAPELGAALTLHAVHQDQVIEPPAGATVLAQSTFCPVAALSYGPAAAPSAISIQPHPEFDAPFVAALLERRRADGGMPAEAVERGLESLGAPVANAEIAAWMARFLRQSVGARRAGAARDAARQPGSSAAAHHAETDYAETNDAATHDAATHDAATDDAADATEEAPRADGGRSRSLAATGVGFVAVLLWSLLALFTVGAGPTPPFQLIAICFFIGGAIGLADLARRGRPLSAAFAGSAKSWALGVGGLFGYHFFYFTALQNAPPAEAGLIAYLWPLLIVLLAAPAPGERLRLGHALGALFGFVGAALILGPAAERFTDVSGAGVGYAAALLCALLWSGYSVLNRVVGEAPTEAVAGLCFAASALGAFSHLGFSLLGLEETRWPSGATEWLAIIGLGLGPVGLAFYVWDYGCKHGDLQLLGVLSYAAPLLSTLILIAAGVAEAGPALIGAAALIVLGSLLAATASLRAQRGAAAS
ncbi:MAG: EamA family transporter [Pseudomonadota bacterium]